MPAQGGVPRLLSGDQHPTVSPEVYPTRRRCACPGESCRRPLAGNVVTTVTREKNAPPTPGPKERRVQSLTQEDRYVLRPRALAAKAGTWRPTYRRAGRRRTGP